MYLDSNYISTVVTDECASNLIYKKQVKEMALLQIKFLILKQRLQIIQKEPRKKSYLP